MCQYSVSALNAVGISISGWFEEKEANQGGGG